MPRLPGTHIDDPRELGRRLREARERAGVSQRQLAFEGCTNAYISRLESGHRIPSLQLIHEFARRLNVSPQWLATGVDDVEASVAALDAEVALRLGDLDEARELYRKMLAENAADAAALAGLGEIAFREERIPRAIALLEQAFAAGEGLLQRPSSVETLARAYVQEGALDSAIALLERALGEAEAAETVVETLRFRVLLANALIDAGDLRRAERMLAESIKAGEELRDPLATARIFWSQSRLHVIHKDAALGVRYARRAIDILERGEDDVYLGLAYLLLAYAEIESGNAESALEKLALGRELFGARLSERDDAKFALEETRALLALGRVKEAARTAADTLEKLEAVDPQDRGRGYLLLGEVFEANGDKNRALGLYELSMTSLEHGGRAYLAEAARRLADLLEEDGRPDEALAVLKRAVGHDRSETRAATPVE